MANQLIADNGSVSGLSGLRYASDSSGILQILTGAGAVALTLDAAQDLTAANTPAQFNNTKKLATTEFVQRALGNWVNQVTYSSNATIGAAQAGYTIAVSANATISINPSGLAVGARFYIVGNGGVVTVNRSDAGNFVSYGVNTVTSISIPSGSGVSLYWDGGSIVIENYDQNMKWSQGFAASLATNGWQRLPSGVLIQWGQVAIAANSTATVTLPLAFPSNFASVTATHGNGGAWQNYNVYVTGPGGAVPISNSQFQISNLDDSTITHYWSAFGY